MEKYRCVYKIEENKNEIRILGKSFYTKNKIFGYYIHKNKKFRLKDIITTESLKEKESKIDLIFCKKINDKSCMFMNCDSLIKFYFLNHEDNEDNGINNYETEDSFGRFDECNYSEKTLCDTLSELESNSTYSEISKKQVKSSKLSTLKEFYKNDLDTISNNGNNTINLISMFYNCSALQTVSNISCWNKYEICGLANLFYNCSSLKSLPDISEWNINNTQSLRAIFHNCSSLLSLPDISKWNTNNIFYMTDIFSDCSSLSSLPDISKWNTSNVVDMSGLFAKCSSLLSLPDISNWNTTNVENMSKFFIIVHYYHLYQIYPNGIRVM